MSFTFNFTPAGMTAEKYNTVTGQLEAAGYGAPKGRLYHVCYGDTDNLHVMDIWDSIENFEEFGNTLMPILQQSGVDPGQPLIQPVHRIIELPVELHA